MKFTPLMARFSLAAVVGLSLTGCGATRNSNLMDRNMSVSGAVPPPGSSLVQESDLRTPQEILRGEEPAVHSQGLPGFSREAVPDRVMLQDQLNAGYQDSPSAID